MKYTFPLFLFLYVCLSHPYYFYGQNDSLSEVSNTLADSLRLTAWIAEFDSLEREERAADSHFIRRVDSAIAIGKELADTAAWLKAMYLKSVWLVDNDSLEKLRQMDTLRGGILPKYGVVMDDSLLNNNGRYKFYVINWRTHIYVDSSSALPFDSILSPTYQSEFIPKQLFDDSDLDSSLVYWVKIRMRGNGKSYQENLLLPNSENQFWQKVAFYRPDLSGGYTMYKGGGTVPVKERMTKDWRDFYKVQVIQNADFVVYFRLSGFKFHSRPTNISFHYLKGSYFEDRQSMLIRVYAFIGILSFMVFFFFFWYVTSKDSSFIPYITYILGNIGVALFSVEFNYWFPNPDFEKYNILNFSFVLFMGISAISMVEFTKRFLNAEDYTPKLNKIFTIYRLIITLFCVFFLVFALLTSFGLWESWFGQAERREYWEGVFNNTLNTMVGVYVAFFLIGFLLICLCGWIAWRKKFKPAKYYLLAISLLVLFVGAIGLEPVFRIDVVSSFKDATTLVQVGILLQLCFFALGLGFKRKLLEDEKITAQEKMLEEQNKVNSAFGRFVPHKFLDAIGRDSVLDIKLGDGVEREVTVFFSDIRGYTRLAEQMTPSENFQFLNGYLGRMGPVISENHGFVNQYYGDGIMAIFMQGPQFAVNGAIEIQHTLQIYNEERIQKGRLPIQIGIGLHTGSLVMGIIGDTLRMEAGVVSDTVNTAARMEGLTKHFGSKILVSETVFKQVDSEKFLYRYLGKVQVKGRNEPLDVYDFFAGDEKEIIEKKMLSKQHFDNAVESYFQQDFATSTRAFESVLEIYPEDKTSQDYLLKTKDYLIHGVEENWSGVVEMHVK